MPLRNGGKSPHTSKYNYIRVHAPERNEDGRIFEHVQIAEKALGRTLPTGVVVHHHDRDGGHNSNGNLVICQDQAYHMLLHARMRVLEAGGDPNLDKLCSCCQYPKAKATEFTRNASCWDGLHPECKRCKYTREAERQKRRRAERTVAA